MPVLPQNNPKLPNPVRAAVMWELAGGEISDWGLEKRIVKAEMKIAKYRKSAFHDGPVTKWIDVAIFMFLHIVSF